MGSGTPRPEKAAGTKAPAVGEKLKLPAPPKVLGMSIPTPKQQGRKQIRKGTAPTLRGRATDELSARAALDQYTERLLGPAKGTAPRRWKAPTGGTTIDWTDDAWNKFRNGTFRGLMAPTGVALSHPAAKLLTRYATKGCPADCGEDWTIEQMEAAIRRGPHPSAYNDGAAEQLREETEEKVTQGYAKVVRWSELKDNPPTKLKISPVAMIPHKSRKYRCILDLSFELRYMGQLLTSVNDATTKQAPQEAMGELGTVLERLIDAVAHANPQDGDIRFSKLDIKDGFWRMNVEEGAEWNFAYVLPGGDPADPELVIPQALQMGWAESPPFFCTATETARDVGQALIDDGVELPRHPLEHRTLRPQEWSDDEIDERAPEFLHLLEVFVDDFIQMAQTDDVAALRGLSRKLMTAVHSIFPPTKVTGHSGQDPLSQKKLDEGEGLWETRKEILGWIFDGVTRCIELKSSRAAKIREEIRAVHKARAVERKVMEKLVGKLRHASLAVPAAKGLFSPLQAALIGSDQQINITPAIKQSLQDWRALLDEVMTEPTHTEELVKAPPSYVGYCDACKFGAGGVWVSGRKELPPFVWRAAFPEEIQRRVVSFSNPNGDITNSDLEMAGVLLEWLALERIGVRLRHEHVGVYCDNTPTVAWSKKLSSTKSKVAARLLMALAMRQRVTRSSPLLTVSIAGKENNMADVASRSFRKCEIAAYSLTDESFLPTFAKHYPPPQGQEWEEITLPKSWINLVMRTISGNIYSLDEWRRQLKPRRNTGGTGKSSSPSKGTDHSSTDQETTPTGKRSFASLAGSGAAAMAEDIVSGFRPSRKRYRPSPRRSTWSDGIDIETQSSSMADDGSQG